MNIYGTMTEKTIKQIITTLVNHSMTIHLYILMYKVCAGRSIWGRHPREITQHRSKNPLYNEKIFKNIYKYEYIKNVERL